MTHPFDPATLAPEKLWSAFAALSRIPRGSGNEEAVAAHLLAEAVRLGLDAERDEAGNVRVRKPATPGREHAPITALQAHMDMVCEKDAGVAHDFGKDPLRLACADGFVKASGTTLGADNGIGVAAALAVMASKDLAHGPLEMLFTVDEERGLAGAVACRERWLQARYLLNLDGEDPTQLCISCAGGLETGASRRVALQPATEGLTGFQLQVGGLQGGHSGVDIHLGRGNAIRVLARALQALMELPGVELATLEGGSRRNVIPREAHAQLRVPPAVEAALRERLAEVLAEVRAELGSFDPGLRMTLEPEACRPSQVLARTEAEGLVALLGALPHGVQEMSPDVPGLVQTSTNLAVLKMEGDRVEILLSHRSSVESAKTQAGRLAATLAERFGFQTRQGGAYPGWKPEPGSDLVALAQEVHQERTGAPLHLRAIHAGLECGILGAKHPGLQMISFGPDILDAHSPQERVGIASVGAFWEFLTALLARI